MGKPKTPSQSAQATPSGSTVSTVNGLTKLGEEYLQAGKMLNDAFKSVSKWPIYQNAFLAVEDFKAYVMPQGAHQCLGCD